MASTTNSGTNCQCVGISQFNSGFRYVEGSRLVNLLREISMPLAETSILGGVKCCPVDPHQAVGRCWRQCDVACGKVLLQSYSVQCIYDDRRHGRGVHPNLLVLLLICTSTLLNCYPWLCRSACTGCCWGAIGLDCTSTFCTSGFIAYDGSLILGLSLSIFFYCWLWILC